jgi:hypothetical protein
MAGPDLGKERPARARPSLSQHEGEGEDEPPTNPRISAIELNEIADGSSVDPGPPGDEISEPVDLTTGPSRPGLTSADDLPETLELAEEDREPSGPHEAATVRPEAAAITAVPAPAPPGPRAPAAAKKIDPEARKESRAMVAELLAGRSLNSAERAMLVLAVGRLLVKKGILSEEELADALAE